MTDSSDGPDRSDFIRDIIDADLASGKHGAIVTRFPPEPNGYLHIGHAKSICLNFGLAEQYGGRCHLRFDDTNPTKEDIEYVESIQRDVRWLGFDWGEHLHFASDYYVQLYEWAEHLIEAGKAYVDSSSEDEIRERRGTISEPGQPGPYRDRSVAENLDLFRRMRAGEFDDGEHVLRAKIDLGAANMKMRDPLMYRIRKGAHHYRTGDAWCIYPFYDFAHGQSDAIEGVTHSICTLEFENNRELYDWYLDNLPVSEPRPRQYEFARLNLNYTVLSKRKLIELVEGGHVSGWDDPRMPTIAGLRRRGYPPEAIRAFCDRVGVARNNSTVDVALLEFCVREHLNQSAPRVMGVLDPLRVTLEGFPEGGQELDAPYFPPDVGKQGSRPVRLSGTLFIERDDFSENPPKKWHRLAPGADVRLRYGPIITCQRVVKDDAGNVTELVCSYDPDAAGERKVRGTIHWVDADSAVDATVHLYDRLFSTEAPGEGDALDDLNPDSLRVVSGAKLERSMASAEPGSRWQLERQGFFVVDEDSAPGALLLNRTVPLKDSWAKQTAPAAEAPKERRAKERKPGPVQKTELSAEERAFADAHGLNDEQARLIYGDATLLDWFDRGRSDAPAKALAALLVTELRRVLKERDAGALPFGPKQLAELARLSDAGTVSATAAKEVFAVLAGDGGEPAEIIAERGLEQLGDSAALEAAIDEVIAAHPAELERYRGGNAGLLGFFVGRVMKATRGKADPKLVNQLLRARLGAAS